MNLTGQVDVPVVGSVDKRVLLGVGGVGAAFLGWKYYQSRSAAAYDPEAAVDPGMEDPGVLPAVSGAVSDTNDYGLPNGSSSSADTYGFTGTTNAQWTQYAANQLSQASDTWSYGTIVTALGAFIANKPLTSVQQQIVQAAMAVAGPAPEGSHVIIPGGDTPMTVAPTGLAGSALSSTSVRLTWRAVAGASGYRIYRSGVTQAVGEANGTTGEVGGLQPGTKYAFQVAAHTGSGQVGPKSGSVSVTTKTVSVKAPGKPVTRGVTKSSLTLTWGAVPGAVKYEVYRNGSAVGSPVSTYLAQSGLKANTNYSYQVVAVGAGNAKSPKSPAVKAKTKK